MLLNLNMIIKFKYLVAHSEYAKIIALMFSTVNNLLSI